MFFSRRLTLLIWIFLLLFLLPNCTIRELAPVTPAPAEQKTPPKLIICIDPGHQLKGNPEKEAVWPGSDVLKDKVSTGTRGVVTKIPEHEINLAVAVLLEKILVADGFQVIMTRDKTAVDISNRERADMANQAGAHLFIRLHCDSSTDPESEGVGILYPTQEREIVPGTYQAGKDMARVLAESLEKDGFKVHNLIPRSDLTGFNWSRVPTVLVEMGFMSNPREDRLLADPAYQARLAGSLAGGIKEAFHLFKPIGQK